MFFLSDSGAGSLFSVCKLLHPFKGCSAYGLSSSACLLQSPVNSVQWVAPFSFNIAAFNRFANSQLPNFSCESVNTMTTQGKHLKEPKGKCALCSAFATLGFPATNLGLAQDAGAQQLGTCDKQLIAQSVGQTWPHGGGGRCLAMGSRTFLPSPIQQT